MREAAAQFDRACRQLRVHRGAFALDDGARDRDDAFRAQGVGLVEHGRAGGEDDLGEAVMVAQVDEQQAAVVALAVHPAGQPGVGPGVAGAEGRAQVWVR